MNLPAASLAVAEACVLPARPEALAGVAGKGLE